MRGRFANRVRSLAVVITAFGLSLAAFPLLPAQPVERPSKTSRESSWTDCPIEFPSELSVDCGVLTVPENRGVKTSHQITLPFAIVRTHSSEPQGDPVVYVTGGPSFNEIDTFSAEFLSSLPFTANRDLIVYNQRGVGFAEPRLGCPELDDIRAAVFPADLTPGQYLDAVEDCRGRLVADGIDLPGIQLGGGRGGPGRP